MILRYIWGRRNVEFLVNTLADVSKITVKTTERGGGEIVETKRLFTGANVNMLHVDGKMQIEMISAWGQKVLSTACVTKGAASNLRKFDIVKTVRVVKEEVRSKCP